MDFKVWMLNKVRIFLCILAITLVSSCASFSIEPPGANNQTILVLPLKVSNTSNHKRPFYEYKYEIQNIDAKSTHEAIFKLTNKEGYVAVKRLAPGSHVITKLFALPVSAGTSFSGNYTSIYEQVDLEYGKITIFGQTLVISVTNDPTDPGRFWYKNEVLPVEQSQRSAILESLRELPNFETWKIQEND